jgi:predicted RNase H-like nuclease (RuvC/YqgF family)
VIPFYRRDRLSGFQNKVKINNHTNNYDKQLEAKKHQYKNLESRVKEFHREIWELDKTKNRLDMEFRQSIAEAYNDHNRDVLVPIEERKSMARRKVSEAEHILQKLDMEIRTLEILNRPRVIRENNILSRRRAV